MEEQNYPYYYSKAAVAGFVLALSSLFLLNFFIFNDIMIRVLGRDLFDIIYKLAMIGGFLTNQLSIVYSIIGLVNSIRYKLKGKGFAIAGIVIFVIVTVIAVMMIGLVLVMAFGGEGRPPVEM